MSHVICIQSKQSELQTIQTHETGLKKKLLPKMSNLRQLSKLSANNLKEGGEIPQIICPVQIRIGVQTFTN